MNFSTSISFSYMVEHFVLEVKLAFVDVLKHYPYANYEDLDHAAIHQYDDVGVGTFQIF
jgi:hypothetical protein